ncbi:unnamed protein product [Orchesella dallaii]|uniref:Nascent polypeptide-associated complex subunit alpha-like UBA domain-containing protein n=1 Tax=Orchesella dallaii TaxID=48710 RepID=A0ABP1S3E4_9HEXA
MPKPNKTETANNDGENDTDLTEESEQEAKKVKEKKHDAGAADLEKVTDYAEETEITGSDISGVRGLIEEEVAGRLRKERELQKVQIKKEDVELLVKELEMPYEKAERTLREHGGNLFDTLVTLTN